MEENFNLSEIPYAAWLEQALRELVTFPVKGICMFATAEDGAIYSNYSEGVSMMDKLTISGLVQHDAVMDSLAANGHISEETEEE